MRASSSLPQRDLGARREHPAERLQCSTPATAGVLARLPSAGRSSETSGHSNRCIWKYPRQICVEIHRGKVTDEPPRLSPTSRGPCDACYSCCHYECGHDDDCSCPAAAPDHRHACDRSVSFIALPADVAAQVPGSCAVGRASGRLAASGRRNMGADATDGFSLKPREDQTPSVTSRCN